MKRLLAILSLGLATACGSSVEGAEGSIRVFAASSLAEAFPKIADAEFQFAGSDELALQLREGAEADVYAAASPRYPSELADEGILESPTTFATNELVLIVPRDNPAGISTVNDLARPDVKLVIGAEGVPVGDYTRTALENLGANDVFDQVVSEEQDVKAVVSKVALGEADAGFVYATDVKVAEEEVIAIGLPAAAQPEVEYAIAVVSDSSDRESAQAFVDAVLGERGREVLREAGFGVP